MTKEGAEYCLKHASKFPIKGESVRMEQAGPWLPCYDPITGKVEKYERSYGHCIEYKLVK